MGVIGANVLRSPAFVGGLLLRLMVIVLAEPWTQAQWFVPFVRGQLFALDPWSGHVAEGGNPLSFPYGAVMYLAHLPFVAVGVALDGLAGTTAFAQIGFAASLLIIDLAALSVLLAMFPDEGRRVTLFYWLSPVILYVTYWNGQTDVVPNLLLLLSLRALQLGRPAFAGGAIGLAVGAKMSALIALPILLIYLWRSRRLGRYFGSFLLAAGATVVATLLPLLLSPGARVMVFGSPEFRKAYLAELPIGTDVGIYLMPLAFGLALYGAWRIGRMSFELLFAFIGIAFLIVLLLTPASVGWFVWVVPFLVAHQLVGGRQAATLALGLGGLWIAYHLAYSPGARLRFTGLDLTPPLVDAFPMLAGHARRLALTAIVAAGAVLGLRMYREGVQRNDFYRLSRKPLAIGIAGDSGAGKDTLSAALAGLFGEERVAALSGDDYHNWDRQGPMWQALTHLNPRANNLHDMTADVLALLDGKAIRCRHYDHATGRFVSGITVERNDVVLVSGLHVLHMPALERALDVRVFLDMDEGLRLFLKTERDIKARGHSPETVANAFARRAPDAQRFIHPQIAIADVIFSLAPVDPADLVSGADMARVPLRLDVIVRHGVFYEELARLLIGLAGMRVDVELLPDRGGAKMTMVGEIVGPDLALIAARMVPQMEELLALVPRWQDGATGLMQLVTLLQAAEAMRMRG
ncbi:MAG: phosphoribulokinase/uridine kinase [Alphaproteobacteria bacterium]|nr:phosphoribulokinase/uridine kinase [Alphaproteobacteria bacterium]